MPLLPHETTAGQDNAPSDPKRAQESAALSEAALNLQIKSHEEHDQKRSFLGTVVGSVYGGDTRSLKELEDLAAKMKGARQAGDDGGYKQSASEVVAAIHKDREALWTADTITGVGTGAVKTGALFLSITAEKGRLATLATAGLYGADQTRVHDSVSNQVLDFGLGAVKGIATSFSFKALGNIGSQPQAEKSLVQGVMSNTLSRGVAYGTTGRFFDLGLSRQTYQNSEGKVDFADGLANVASGTFASKAMAADALLFGAAGLGGKATGLFRSEVNPVVGTMATSSMFGLSSGLYSEFSRQKAAGEDLSVSKLLMRGAAQAVADGLAGVPAGRALGAATAAERTVSENKTVERTDRSELSGKSDVGAKSAVVEAGSAEARLDQAKPAEVRQSDIKGGNPLDEGARIIDKPNGDRLIIRTNGDKVLERPGQPKMTYQSDGRVIVEEADGRTTEYRSKANTPLEERPLNVASSGGEAVGKALSNFSRRPFTLDGRQYESVEGFYQGLKWSEPAKRAEIAMLSGPEARSAGRGSQATSFEYEGRNIEFRSPEHYALMKRAIKASLEQNPEVLDEFLNTYPRPIEHKTGRPERSNTGYPAVEFVRALTEVRSELHDRMSSVGDTPMSQNVADLIRGYDAPDIRRYHNLALYAKAFADFESPATRVVTAGSDHVVLKLADGNLLKITPRTLERERADFDMPVIKEGSKTADGRIVNFVVTPEAQPADASDLLPFLQELAGKGYKMTDPGVAQIGKYEGRTRLLDPFAVVPER